MAPLQLATLLADTAHCESTAAVFEEINHNISGPNLSETDMQAWFQENSTPIADSFDACRVVNPYGVVNLYLSFVIDEGDRFPKFLRLIRSGNVVSFEILALSSHQTTVVASVSGDRKGGATLGIKVGSTPTERATALTALGNDPCINNGTRIMVLVLGMCHLLRYEKVGLGDAATQVCGNDHPFFLSLFRLLLDKPGFYEGFGFRWRNPDKMATIVQETQQLMIPFVDVVRAYYDDGKYSENNLCTILSKTLAQTVYAHKAVFSAEKTISAQDWERLMTSYHACGGHNS